MKIEDFQESFNNKEINLKPYLIIVSVLLCIILVFMLINNRIKDYYIGTSKVKEEKLVTVVRNEDLDYLVNNNKIIIERNMFTYEIDKINEITYNNSLYNEVIIKVNELDKDLLIDNNVINYKVITDNISIFEYLFKVIKGEWLIKEISKEELESMNGGGLSTLGIAGIVAGVVFIIGVIDGYVRPSSCIKMR